MASEKTAIYKNKKVLTISGVGLFFTAVLVGVATEKNKKFNTKITTLKNRQTMNEQLLKYIKDYYKPLPFVKFGNMEQDAVSFVLMAEGGLTDDQSDSAHIDPVNVPFTYKGRASKLWHSNKGITWTAFKNHFGKNVDPMRFYNMSNSDWFSVFNNDYVKAFSTTTNNKLINLNLGLWAWGSGIGGASKLLKKFITENGSLQALINANKSDAFERIILHRIRFFESIAQPGTKNNKYLKGWINRTLNFYENFKQYA